MNVFYYVNAKTQKAIAKSGIGRAHSHQLRAAELAGITPARGLFDADVVHLNTVFPNSVITALRAKLAGVPIVYHAHSTREDFRNSYIGANVVCDLFKEWIIFCYGLGDVIVTPSTYSKRLLEGYGIKKKIFAISNGIDLADYERDEEKGREFRRKFGYSDEDKIIMSAGLLMKRKGVADFARLARMLPEYKFIWFGTANMSLVGKETRDAVLKSRLPNLVFAGHVEKSDLQAAYSGADLFLFPSYEETEGIVTLEALASKIPVLVRDIPVYDGWLENRVSAYMARDTEEFAELARGILEGELPDLTEAGYEQIKKKSIEKVGAKLLEAYREAVRVHEAEAEKRAEMKKKLERFCPVTKKNCEESAEV